MSSAAADGAPGAGLMRYLTGRCGNSYSLLMARCHKSYLIDQRHVALLRPNRSKGMQNRLGKSLLMIKRPTANVVMTPGATVVSMTEMCMASERLLATRLEC